MEHGSGNQELELKHIVFIIHTRRPSGHAKVAFGLRNMKHQWQISALADGWWLKPQEERVSIVRHPRTELWNTTIFRGQKRG